MIDRDLIESRLAGLQSELDNAVKLCHTLDGAIQDCHYWLDFMDASPAAASEESRADTGVTTS